MKNKYIRFIVIAYVSLNILGVVFYCTIPKGNFVQNKSNVDLNQLLNMKNEIMNNPHILSVNSSEDKYNIKNYNFNYKGKELEIILAKKHHLVFIDRRASDDNKIEVYCYPGPIIFNGLVFTNVLKEPNIKLIGNELNIEYKKQNYSFTQFSKDIVINQFYEKKDNGATSFGSGVIYIRIPKTLKILGDEAYR